ncbi:MAG TPA: hypothetical protein VGL39_03070 [Jatrophihabitantaceae bacterium]|jgi:hypothetical protein
MSNAVRPEDVLPDDVSRTMMNGVNVRKGSVAAFVANAKALEALAPTTPEYAEVAAQLQALAPAVAAVGLFDVFELRSVEIAKIVDAAVG